MYDTTVHYSVLSRMNHLDWTKRQWLYMMKNYHTKRYMQQEFFPTLLSILLLGNFIEASKNLLMWVLNMLMVLFQHFSILSLQSRMLPNAPEMLDQTYRRLIGLYANSLLRQLSVTDRLRQDLGLLWQDLKPFFCCADTSQTQQTRSDCHSRQPGSPTYPDYRLVSSHPLYPISQDQRNKGENPRVVE